VEHPSNPRADAAYDRALAAYRDKSYDVARRWIAEALAHNKQHAAARALLGRLDASRPAMGAFEDTSSGPEVISTDPTVLISRASHSEPKTGPIDPTVLVSRDHLRPRLDDTDSGRLAPGRPVAPPVSEPTVMAPAARARPSSRPSKKGFSLGASLQSLGERLQGGGRRPRPSDPPRAGATKGSGISSPGARGALLAIATVAVGAVLVMAVLLMVRWVWPPGQLLTITKPVGGTIVGPGIECGTGGSRCSNAIATGEPIGLETRPDKDYVFSGFTGDCAPAGRTAMTESRTCGANFDPVARLSGPTTFRLTIIKPEGGTIVGAGGILCGVNGSTCSADVPSGAPVTLRADAADGFAWQQFTGDCPSTGETTMTSAKTCGAMFIPSGAPINRGVVAAPPAGPRPVSRPTQVAPPPVVATNPQPPVPTNPTGSQGPAPTATTAPTLPDKPAAAPITAEEHAKQEIAQLVKNYCAALATLRPERVRSLFHLDNERLLRDQYREYKSLKCTVSSPPEYDRLDASAAGAAQLKVGLKQAVEMRSGGAPKDHDFIVTMVVSRREFQSPWLIDRVLFEPKPK
jgi:hypothetical protein